MKKILDKELSKLGINQSVFIIKAFPYVPIAINIEELSLEQYLSLSWEDNPKYSRTAALLLTMLPDERIYFPKRVGKGHILKTWETGDISVSSFQEIYTAEDCEVPDIVLERLPFLIIKERHRIERFLSHQPFYKFDIQSKGHHFAYLWMLQYIEKYGL